MGRTGADDRQGQASGTAKNGELQQDETWNKTSGPYWITDDLIIPQGVILTIENGTEIRFELEVSLIIRGDLIIKGTNISRVTMGPNSSSWEWAGSWNGILFEDNPNSISWIRGVNISYPYYGLSIKDTADTLDVSESVVKTRLFRARNILRQELNEYFSKVT